MKWIFLFLISLCFNSLAQNSSIVMGNHEALTLPDSSSFFRVDHLPDRLDTLCCVFLFSNAQSTLKDAEVDSLIHFVQQGGGLYVGAENWPLQSESRLITQRIYGKESFGLYNDSRAEYASTHDGLLSLDELEYIPAGNSTVAFPLDPRLRVEAWVNDQPLILSGFISRGRIIIDGGYSRFYSENRCTQSDAVFLQFFHFLRGH